MKLPDTDRLIQLIKWLFWLNAAVWLAFGIGSMVRIGAGAPGGTAVLGLIAILMLMNVAAFLWCSWTVQKQASWYRFTIMAVLAVNILLTFTDQFGLLDFLTLLLDLILLALVLLLHAKRSRAWL
ncbi:MAG: hypothetical protein H6657_04015 [Ardenticatenaceae bacterium]|nr:hypothetical protein [Ardenticatenaceae bacterium]